MEKNDFGFPVILRGCFKKKRLQFFRLKLLVNKSNANDGYFNTLLKEY